MIFISQFISILFQKLISFFSQTNQTVINTESELNKDEAYLEGTVSAVTTLHNMVKEKQKEVQLLEKDRDDILQAVEQV